MKHQIGKKITLCKIRREFSKEADDRTYRALAYSTMLRDLALAGLQQGHTVAQVALAAGISISCLRGWLREAGVRDATKKSAIELTLMTEPEGARDVKPEPLARIRFRSGVKLELPVSALTPLLMGALNGGAL